MKLASTLLSVLALVNCNFAFAKSCTISYIHHKDDNVTRIAKIDILENKNTYEKSIDGDKKFVLNINDDVYSLKLENDLGPDEAWMNADRKLILETTTSGSFTTAAPLPKGYKTTLQFGYLINVKAVSLSCSN